MSLTSRDQPSAVLKASSHAVRPGLPFDLEFTRAGLAALVQDWDDEQYATAVWAVIDDLRRRGIRVEGLDYKLMPLPL